MLPKQNIPTLAQALSGTLFGSAGVAPKDSKEVVKIDPEVLIEIEDQPFRLYSPEKLQELADDIRLNGQISPCVVRKTDDQYVVLAGRNRKRACALAGLKVDCIIIECDDASANLIVVNSNMLQRLELLPSEKAFGYKLQKQSYEAKGQRKSTAAVAEQNSENIKMVQRYIKLTDLNKELLDMVDEGRLPVTVGYELSYLSPANMDTLSSYLLTIPDKKISVEQAQILHDRNATYNFTVDWLDSFFRHPEMLRREQKQTDKVSPVEPQPVVPQPVVPQPVVPQPVESQPVEPLPVEPQPMEPLPVEPLPVEPLLNGNQQITKEKILSITNNLKRDEFLDGWTEWPILVEVPKLKLTVRQVILPDKKRIVSLEYGRHFNTSYRNCYFQLLGENVGISPFNDVSRANIIDHLKSLRMKLNQQ
ncbi:ParB/RepB/Spo0J family partition protein [Faecalispora anaeroviscerum]|uniref:ParB/RepB/Spo0J family partition protein n=1 Tax=Faecalispora anaeroviscerum TaxID=2991836 RepID=UPI0024BBC6B3|nr:ParB/RepB/Spo0J family partition protein [Faecalispora anaeroviscerum]